MKRLDIILAEKGFCKSRSAAAGLIKEGKVLVNGQESRKPAQLVSDDDEISLKEKMEFVGRGGLKLKKAISDFQISLTGAICADIGASTGGFTDCMLQNGAAKVYAIDVGSGQLDPSLAADSRVVNMENTNIRYLSENAIPPMDFIGVDVSFISLSYVFPLLSRFLKESGSAVCLIKPQFEAGRENVGKGGLVKSAKIHEQVIGNLCEIAKANGLYPVQLDFSPIKGGDGNREYLIYLKRQKTDSSEIKIQNTIKAAFQTLGR